MRLEPIDRPSSLLGRVMSFGMKRMLGRAIAPARVMYNRVPRLWNVSFALLRLDASLEIPTSLNLLVKTHLSMRNGCDFCQDIARAMAVREEVGLERFDALHRWRESELFDEGERAALAYAEAVNERRVDDAVFAELRKHWSERAIVEITVCCAVENYYNTLNLALDIHGEGLEGLARQARAA